MLHLFDADGTIVDRDSTMLYPIFQAWLMGLPDTDRVAIVTNQGGVGFRWACENDRDRKEWAKEKGIDLSKYPTEARVNARLSGLAQQIKGLTGRFPNTYACFAYVGKDGAVWPRPENYDGGGRNEWSPEWRKPNPGMLLTAMRDMGGTPINTVMYGDREEDKGAAQAAGVRFVGENAFPWKHTRGIVIHHHMTRRYKTRPPKKMFHTLIRNVEITGVEDVEGLPRYENHVAPSWTTGVAWHFYEGKAQVDGRAMDVCAYSPRGELPKVWAATYERSLFKRKGVAAWQWVNDDQRASCYAQRDIDKYTKKGEI